MLKVVVAMIVVAGTVLPASTQTIESIQDSGELTIGFRTDAVPLSYIDKDDKPAGYTPMVCVEVAKGIAASVQMKNIEVSFVPVETHNQFEMVANGTVDLLCGASTITMRRREIVDFSIPVYVDGAGILVPKDPDSKGSDSGALKVGVRAGTTTEEAAEITLISANVDAEVVSFESHVAAIDALRQFEIDAYLADRSILFGLLVSNELTNSHVISDDLLTFEKHGLAMARGDIEFKHLVDSILSNLFTTGKMQELFGITFPGSEPGLAMRAMYLMSPTLP